MKHYQNIKIEALGESTKVSDVYTCYDYIELAVDGRIEQVRSVFVHDMVNSGLSVGIDADIVIGELIEYSLFTTAIDVTELFVLKTSRTERASYETLIDELNRKPTLLGLIPWMLLMPLRAMRGGGHPIGMLLLLYWVVIATPFVAPFTYFKRYKRHAELVEDTQRLFAKLNEPSSTIKPPDELVEVVSQLEQ